MKALSGICSIILVLLWVSLQPNVIGQDIPQYEAQEPHFSILQVKTGNQFTGELIDTVDQKIIFRDNQLGELSIGLDQVKLFEAEDTASFYRLILHTGSILIGKITNRSPGIVTLQTAHFGGVQIYSDVIFKTEKLATEHVGEKQHLFSNPNYTRYFFAPTAIPMEKGEWYYQNAYVLANSGNIGVTDNFTLGGGIIIPLAAYITPKYGVEVFPGFYTAVGCIYSLLPVFDEGGGTNHLALGYGLFTVGNYDRNLTLGLGHGYLGKDWMSNPIATVNGMTRISRRVMLITENWMINYKATDFPQTYYQNEFLFSYGARFLWPRMAVDVAFYNNASISEMLLIGVPYIDFVLKF